MIPTPIHFIIMLVDEGYTAKVETYVHGLSEVDE